MRGDLTSGAASRLAAIKPTPQPSQQTDYINKADAKSAIILEPHWRIFNGVTVRELCFVLGSKSAASNDN